MVVIGVVVDMWYVNSFVVDANVDVVSASGVVVVSRTTLDMASLDSTVAIKQGQSCLQKCL